jgi:hypothetical protein
MFSIVTVFSCKWDLVEIQLSEVIENSNNKLWDDTDVYLEKGTFYRIILA